MKCKLYIAYGSNINLFQMAVRCPCAKVIGTSMIKDYALVFRGSPTRAVVTIEKCPNASVPVLVWSVEPSDEKALDRYEGYPHLYTKQDFQVSLNGNTVTAMAYVMTPGKEPGMPSRFYLQTITDGYAKFNFPKKTLFDSAVAVERNRQEQNAFAICPRCGKRTMRDKLIHNALSRRADIYVCEPCGMSEALCDAMGIDDDIVGWNVFK